MKAKQFFTKTLLKSASFLMIGATVIGSSAGATVYAKEINETCNIKVNTCTLSCDNIPSQDCPFDPSWKPEDCNPGHGPSKPDNTPSNPDHQPSKPDYTLSKQTKFENRVLELINIERQRAGLRPLKMDERVRKVARLKSEDMRTQHYFDHNSPTYGSPFDMLKQFGIRYRSAGENIAQGYSTPEAVVNGWMNSSGHRANILNPNFTHIGIGYDAKGHYWTQMFIQK